MDYSPQADNFNDARTYLMLPHPDSEATSIADAFHAFELGLDGLDISNINEDMMVHISTIKKSIKSKHDKKTHQAIAESLTVDQKSTLSTSIRELADHFILLDFEHLNSNQGI